MNKYFYPIYKMKLKPWIKYWVMKKDSIPNEFEKLEFVEFGNNGVRNFVDIGTPFDNLDFEFKIKMQYYVPKNWNCIFGNPYGNNSSTESWIYSNKNIALRINGFGSISIKQVEPNETFEFKVVLTDKIRFYINDIFEKEANPPTEVVPNMQEPMGVGSRVLGGTLEGRVYYIEINKSRIPYRKMIPAKEKATEKEGFYDLVTKQFYELKVLS